MAAPTPQITLTINLLDFSGNQIGSSAQPASVRIMLAGYGRSLPRVSGAGMIGEISSSPVNIPYTGSVISVPLWGNDAIVPPGTWYDIAILDAGRNVVQAASYQFSDINQSVDLGTTIDLSTATPYNPIPAAPAVSGYLIPVPFSVSPFFDAGALGVQPSVTFEMTLTGDAVASLANAVPGQLVNFVLKQDAVGGHLFSWPGQCKNPGTVDLNANGVTAQNFLVDSLGNLYLVGSSTHG
jgi:hypothetical protein